MMALAVRDQLKTPMKSQYGAKFRLLGPGAAGHSKSSLAQFGRLFLEAARAIGGFPFTGASETCAEQVPISVYSHSLAKRTTSADDTRTKRTRTANATTTLTLVRAESLPKKSMREISALYETGL